MEPTANRLKRLARRVEFTGHDDDSSGYFAAVHLEHRLESALSRHDDVQQENVDRGVAENAYRFLAVLRLENRVIRFFQDGSDRLAKHRIVVGN